ncbi:hypothetical protein [Streptomyces sp. KL116D]|uniref:hypothetical protein n=1 Tax=Streptomyces sp. KL116D TaxID=3045152 RepID=UPI00355859E9
MSTGALAPRDERADLDLRTVALADWDETVPYSGLVVATGMRPRAACAAPALTAGRHTVRTLDDAQTCETALTAREFASSRRRRIIVTARSPPPPWRSAPPRSPSPTRCRRPCVGLARRTSRGLC